MLSKTNNSYYKSPSKYRNASEESKGELDSPSRLTNKDSARNKLNSDLEFTKSINKKKNVSPPRGKASESPRPSPKIKKQTESKNQASPLQKPEMIKESSAEKIENVGERAVHNKNIIIKNQVFVCNFSKLFRTK